MFIAADECTVLESLRLSWCCVLEEKSDRCVCLLVLLVVCTGAVSLIPGGAHRETQCP